MIHRAPSSANAGSVGALRTLASEIERASQQTLIPTARVRELSRRIAALDERSDKADLDRVAQLSESLVRELRLPEQMLEPLRAQKLIGSGYGGLAPNAVLHAPLTTGSAIGLRAKQSVVRRKFPDAYRAQPKKLLPKPEKPLPKEWTHAVSSFPGRPGPGSYGSNVAIESLPTLPIHEAVHRLLFARALGTESNWAACTLLEPDHMKWPAEDHDPLVKALMDRLAKQPPSLSKDALSDPLWRVGSARLIFALVEEMLDFADKDGRIDLGRWMTHYHREPMPPRHSLIEELARALGSPVDSPDAPIATKLDPIATGNLSFKRTLPLCENYKELSTIVAGLEKRFPTLVTTYLAEHFGCPPTLPALELAAQGVPADHFEDSVILCAQHLLPSQVPMFDKLLEHGATPKDVIVAGVPYSTNPLASQMLTMRGIEVVPSEEVDTSLLGRYEIARKKELENAVEVAVERAKTTGKNLVVLDDGGIVNQMLHEKHPDLLKKTRLVEQTTRGLTEASRLKLGCPVVNVAKSEGKIEEAPFIAEDLMRGLAQLLPHAGISDLAGVNITIVGFGTIGDSLASLCTRAGMKVSVADLDPEKRKAAEAAGYSASADVAEAAKNARIVLGCTGKRSLPRDVIDRLPDGVLLASGSSAEIEIDIEHLLAHGDMRFRVPVQTYWLGEKRVLLANGGRPVNFDNAKDIAPEKIQLTRSLMFRGAVQAAGMDAGSPPGLVALEKTGQADVLSYLRKEVWPKLTPEVTRPVARLRDETLWNEVVTASKAGKDLFEQFDAHGGDTMFWLRSVLAAAPVALEPATRQDSTSAKMRMANGHVRRENVPTIIADPSGKLFVVTPDDNLVPPLFELPLQGVTPVRLERVSPMIRHEKGRSIQDYVLWTDDAQGKRTAQIIRLDYEPIQTDPKTLRPVLYGKDIPTPKLKAKILANLGSASVIGDMRGMDGAGSEQGGLVLKTDKGLVKLRPDGVLQRGTTGEAWFGSVRFDPATKRLECYDRSRLDREKKAPLPLELRSVELPANVESIEASKSAFKETGQDDRWPELNAKDYFATTAFITRNKDGTRSLGTVDWRLPGRSPALVVGSLLPDDATLRHMEPKWTDPIAGNKRVGWEIQVRTKDGIDEPSFWKTFDLGTNTGEIHSTPSGVYTNKPA